MQKKWLRQETFFGVLSLSRNFLALSRNFFWGFGSFKKLFGSLKKLSDFLTIIEH